MSNKADECVKVVVRIRPMNSEEERNGNSVGAEAFPDRGLIVVKNPKANENEPPKNFTFDSVFAASVEQKFIYDTCAAGVVESVLNGYNGTIFAYGQTGAGKTHTMEGRPDPPNLRGIIPNSFQHIFEYVSSARDIQFLVRASYLEIYNEEIRDLLSKDPKNSLELKENIDTGVYVKDLTSFVVKNVNEIDHVMQSGKKNRSVGATLMNATSSRSHSIFTIVIESSDSTDKGDHIRVGKLNLVDLAGSERQSKTGATGDRLKEATKINLSLAALGNVISALVDGKASYIPYRDSKLTRLLQNSLGGNAKTVMCANCGPADYNYDETLSTLRYANRAKNIKNKPKINEDPKDAMLREYQEEISRLKEQLEATQRGVVLDDQGKEVPMKQEIRYIESKPEIIERIVEKEVIKEVQVGISNEEMARLRKQQQDEKHLMMRQAAEDMQQLIDQQSRTAAERTELQSRLEKEALDRKKIEEQKAKLSQKLKMMEEKLIKGGEVISKASQQEVQLRKAEQELRERQAEEQRLGRELQEKEEANLQLEEHFSSLQEEVEVKTKKLKKLWGKYQGAVQEAQDLQEEFQTERSDMLDTIRQLTRTMKLKELIIANFIPEEHAKGIEKRSVWNPEDDCWTVQKMDYTGNKTRNIRPISNAKLKRPETEFARQRKQHDPNPRYKGENIASLELDAAERTTQDFEGPGMVARVDPILRTSLNAEDGEDVIFSDSGGGMANPYQQYAPEAGADDRNKAEKQSRPKSGNSSKRPSSSSRGTRDSDRDVDLGSTTTSTASSNRPKSASRKRTEKNDVGSSNSNSSSNRDIQRDRDDYPSARRLVRK